MKLDDVLNILEQAIEKNHYQALDDVIKNGNEELEQKINYSKFIPHTSNLFVAMSDNHDGISVKNTIIIAISSLGNKEIIDHYSHFLFKNENLSVIPMFFANRAYIEAISDKDDVLNQLKEQKINLRSDISVNFFSVIASSIKEKELLNKLLTPQDIEQMYIEDLQGQNNHPIYGLLQSATLHENIEFIDIFLNKAEKKVQEEQPALLRFNSQDSGIDSGFNNTPSNGSIASESEGEDSRPNTPINKLNLSPFLNNDQELYVQGFKEILFKVLEVGISFEKDKVIEYLYKRFNETKILEIKEAFTAVIQDQRVIEELKKQKTTRPASIQVHDIINKWLLDIELEPRFEAIKDSICKLDKTSYSNIEQIKEVYILLHGLKNDLIDKLQTAICEKKYGLIKSIRDKFEPNSLDIQEIFSKVIGDDKIQQSIENSKEVKEILYGNQKSRWNGIKELILKIKNIINEIINYFHQSDNMVKLLVQTHNEQCTNLDNVQVEPGTQKHISKTCLVQ